MFLKLFSPKNLQIKEQFMASANIGGYVKKCSINEVTFVPRATYSLPSGRRRRLPSLWEQTWPFDLWRETTIDRWYRGTEKEKEKKKETLCAERAYFPATGEWR